MSNILDTILIKEIVSTTEVVNTDYVSDSIDISFRENEFSIQVNYSNGVNVDMEVFVEVSNDNVNFGRIDDPVPITDSDEGILFDIFGTGTNFLRIGITVNSGSINLDKIIYKAKRRH